MTKPNVILQAARHNDIDAAVWTLQDALGVATGDLAAYHLPDGETWASIDLGRRLAHIGEWLKQEALSFDGQEPTPAKRRAGNRAEAIALGLPGCEQRRARFWHLTETGEPIKIKLETGDVARHTSYYVTDEGWERVSREWWFDGETLHLSWHRDSRDCDGRLERTGESTCAFDRLQAGYACPDHVAVRYPAWEDGRYSQRDHAAEAAGY